MTVKGLTSGTYWLSNYVYAIIIFSALGFGYCALARSFNMQSFLNCGWSRLSALTLCWSHAQAMMAFFFAGVSHDPKITSISCYILLFALTIGGGIINRPDQGIVPYPWLLMMFPPMAYSRTLALCLLYGGKTAPFGSPLSEAFLYLFFVSLIWGGVGIYFHMSNSWQHFGCNRSGSVEGVENVCLQVLRRKAALHGPNSDATEAGSVELGSNVPFEVANRASAFALGTDDELVQEAAQLVRSGEAATDPQTSILLEGFKRIYPARGNAPPKVAVDGVDLSIRCGEFFGLLGPNGAGKTTLLETLSGLAVPQGGKAIVGGFDMSKDIKKALTVIGVCPQFDVVWNQLSVMGHLLLYARLKGIPKERQRAAANLAAIKVGLDGDAIGMAASELSGGMTETFNSSIPRRRSSI